ncbi:MAG: hypothetical protein B7Z02_08765 [Rhodobacterales bacterium 32-67-9]|nr:MAG: hypothetical protein B7Z02_08765 [Rhodobacterales bacterium 32-67-9]
MQLGIRIGAVLVPVLYLFYRIAWLPFLLGHYANDRRWEPLGPASAVVYTIVLAAGLSTLTAIALLHWRRRRFVFRRSTARMIGATIITALTPVAVFGGFPFILLPMLLFMSPIVFESPLRFLIALAIALGLIFPAWYVVSSVLVAGTRRKPVRFLAFCMMWWAVYAFHRLAFNLPSFVL